MCSTVSGECYDKYNCSVDCGRTKKKKMKIVQQARKLKMKNMDLPEGYTKGGGGSGGGGGARRSRHRLLLPDSIRSIVCGPSACGKTNVMFNLLFDVNGLRFANLYVFSKSLFQRKYRMLETLMSVSYTHLDVYKRQE